MISAFAFLAAPSLFLGGVILSPGVESSLLDGDPLRLRIEGVAPGHTVLVHSFRTLPKWNGTATVPVLLHACTACPPPTPAPTIRRLRGRS